MISHFGKGQVKAKVGFATLCGVVATLVGFAAVLRNCVGNVD